jgi:hypothetical protein
MSRGDAENAGFKDEKVFSATLRGSAWDGLLMV